MEKRKNKINPQNETKMRMREIRKTFCKPNKI